MKFSNILKGTQAEERVEVPGFQMPDGNPWTVLMRPLTGFEYANACADARQFAESKGVKTPSLGEPIYDLALASHILLIGCVDPDTPSTKREPVFSSMEEIMKDMHPEHIVYLHTRHERWQNECSPTNDKVTDENLLDKVREVTGPDGVTNFMRFSPSMQVSFVISMANTLLPLLEGKYSPGLPSENEAPITEPLQ